LIRHFSDQRSVLLAQLVEQAASKETDEDFAWKEKTKQQLGYYYGMHAPQAGTMPVTAENLETYKAYLEEENKLEWFEQVAIITDDVIKNGKDSKVDKTAGVTIITDKLLPVNS